MSSVKHRTHDRVSCHVGDVVGGAVHDPDIELRSADAGREAGHAPAMPNGRCRMHGGRSPGAPKGNKNALKHGRYG